MKTTKNDCAFPIVSEDILIESVLTKREYFAAMAMQGLCASYGDLSLLAEDSVRMADALIAELNKEQE